MKYDYDLVVIGGGSGGLVVASGSVSLGAKVALIEKEKMGGDCLNSGCVPSKSFLKGAHLAKDIDSASLFGLNTQLNEVSIKKLMSRVQQVITSIEPHDSVERYEGLGVEVIIGAGELIDPHHVKVGDKVLYTKNIVISSGSKPYTPPIKGLDQVPYLTNRNIFNLTTQPKHLIVLGGGPIGLELGQGFRHLGSEVTIIDQNLHLFAKDDPEVGPLMEEILLQEGVCLHLSTKIVEVQTKNKQITVIVEKNGLMKEIVGDQLLVSLGRSPVTEDLGLEKVGVKVNQRGYIITNNKLQTNFKNIYACGDVTGPFQFTHMAGYQAGIVIRNSIFHLGTKLDYSAVPWTTYTKPEVAHVGHTEVTAKESSVFKKSILVPLGDNDRARAENDEKGFLKLIINHKNKLIGATLVGEKAGEMIPVATLAIRQNLKASSFLDMIFSYPTEAEIYKAAALKELRDSVKPWQSKLIKFLFLKH